MQFGLKIKFQRRLYATMYAPNGNGDSSGTASDPSSSINGGNGNNGGVASNIFHRGKMRICAKEYHSFGGEISDDWIPGVFSTLWQKCNDRKYKFKTWLTCDGPVDTIWI